VGKWFVIAAALCACSSSDPNGVYWDSTNRTLYLTDDKRDLILRRRAQAFEESRHCRPRAGSPASRGSPTGASS
jgi:sugar lactone lactonase YvrE